MTRLIRRGCLLGILIVSCTLFPYILTAQIILNESVSDNQSGLQDFLLEFGDWLEIYNSGEEDINLENYILSDEDKEWTFPALTIAANNYLVIFASGKDTVVDNQIHCNFSINAGGEAIQLTNPNGALIDQLPHEGLLADQSLSRQTDSLDSSTWSVVDIATPGSINHSWDDSINWGFSLNEVVSFSTDHDWVEIYNGNSQSASFGGYYLSDDPDSLLKWQCPPFSIPAKSTSRIFASGLDGEIDGDIHSNFSISKGGEEIFLSGPFGIVIGKIRIPELAKEFSFGKTKEEAAGWVEFCQASPSGLNVESLQDVGMNLSLPAGHYLEEMNLEMVSEADSDCEIRYTTDGSIPDMNSLLYEEAILLTDRKGESDVYSIIQCTEEPYEPLKESQKINVIRARVFCDSVAINKVQTHSYLIDDNPLRYSLPIISIAGNSADFFDLETGICKNYYNKGRDWERKVSMEYFHGGELVLTQNCGIRLHGGISRESKQKSFALYARQEYQASTFAYPFFETKEIPEFKRLLLRAPRGYNETFYSDELSTSLVEDLDLATQAHTQVVVFLNGEYWGFYHLKEKIDEHFVFENYGGNKDSVAILSNDPFNPGACDEGDCSDFVQLIDSIKNTPEIGEEFYSYLESKIDLDGFVDYLCANFYCHNYDWPSNNTRVWRRSPQDRWQYNFHDLDFSMYEYDHDLIPVYFENSNAVDWWFQPAFKFFAYEPFRNRFLDRFEVLLQENFAKEKVLNEIQYLEEIVAPEYEEHQSRFAIPITVEERLSKIEALREFADLRPCAIQEDLQEVFNQNFMVDFCSDTIDQSTGLLPIDKLSEWDCHFRVNERTLEVNCWGDITQYDLTIVDLSGRVHLRHKNQNPWITFRKQLGRLSAGLYFLRVYNGSEYKTKKLMIN